MSEQGGRSKRAQLVADLATRIRSGRLGHGERLPGENQLAQTYAVSRGTVRSALAELQRRDLIETETGVGSFVTFDGARLDQQLGWARALAGSGAEVTTELLGIVAGGDPAVEEREGPLVTVRRLRRSDGRPVSLETASLPATAELAGIPERGLVDGSITATLAAAGLHGATGEQWISAEPLDATDAARLERAPGDLFLRATRVTRTAGGGLAEHVVSLLDPQRFRFHLAFGGTATTGDAR
ncbi:GntR family transcriptional regulator [Pseudonocardia parietis]|uniref:GntR family transcriptional regulator n=1 Tax=Pseudonocardia parietis TaxID=570936 RepID=A0ABS4W328_9PSEU|nr:GntR family transcriptional regulator [Pseudonocardia parietis]MBP2370612.1 GntR family transcriptional regulator [Pseudonocardia parietis]